MDLVAAICFHDASPLVLKESKELDMKKRQEEEELEEASYQAGHVCSQITFQVTCHRLQANILLKIARGSQIGWAVALGWVYEH